MFFNQRSGLILGPDFQTRIGINNNVYTFTTINSNIFVWTSHLPDSRPDSIINITQ